MAKGEYVDGKVKVTVRLPPALMKRTKLEAVRRSTTVQALIEQGLKRELSTRTA
jgi:predicted DNA binding CopG/RHH family protein